MPPHQCSASTRRGQHNPRYVNDIPGAEQPNAGHVHAKGSITRHTHKTPPYKLALGLYNPQHNQYNNAPPDSNSTHWIRSSRETLELPRTYTGLVWATHSRRLDTTVRPTTGAYDIAANSIRQDHTTLEEFAQRLNH